MFYRMSPARREHIVPSFKKVMNALNGRDEPSIGYDLANSTPVHYGKSNASTNSCSEVRKTCCYNTQPDELAGILKQHRRQKSPARKSRERNKIRVVKNTDLKILTYEQPKRPSQAATDLAARVMRAHFMRSRFEQQSSYLDIPSPKKKEPKKSQIPIHQFESTALRQSSRTNLFATKRHSRKASHLVIDQGHLSQNFVVQSSTPNRAPRPGTAQSMAIRPNTRQKTRASEDRPPSLARNKSLTNCKDRRHMPFYNRISHNSKPGALPQDQLEQIDFYRRNLEEKMREDTKENLSSGEPDEGSIVRITEESEPMAQRPILKAKPQNRLQSATVRSEVSRQFRVLSKPCPKGENSVEAAEQQLSVE